MKKYKNIISKYIFNIYAIIVLLIITLIPFLMGISMYNFFYPLSKNYNIFKDIILSYDWQPFYNKFGLLNFILISIKIILLSFFVSFILSLFTSIFLSQILSNIYYRIALFIFEFMTFIPSFIFAYWGIVLILPFLKEINVNLKYFPIIFSSFLLGYMVCPFMVVHITKILKNNYNNYLFTAYNPELTKYEIFKNILKKTYKSIILIFSITFTKITGEAILLWMVFTYLRTSNIVINTNNEPIVYPLNVLITENYSKVLTFEHLRHVIILSTFLVFILNFVINFFTNSYFEKLLAKENE